MIIETAGVVMRARYLIGCVAKSVTLARSAENRKCQKAGINQGLLEHETPGHTDIFAVGSGSLWGLRASFKHTLRMGASRFTGACGIQIDGG